MPSRAGVMNQSEKGHLHPLAAPRCRASVVGARTMVRPPKYTQEERAERHREQDRAWYARNREKLGLPPRTSKYPGDTPAERSNARSRAWKQRQKEIDPEYRAKVRERERERYADSETGARMKETKKQYREKINAQSPDGFFRIRNLWTRYGLTPEQYHGLYNNQKGCCAICGEHRPKLHIDHNHKTKVVRGLLCENCNRMLGMAHERLSVLRSAVTYLQKYGVSEDDNNLRVAQLSLFEPESRTEQSVS